MHYLWLEQEHKSTLGDTKGLCPQRGPIRAKTLVRIRVAKLFAFQSQRFFNAKTQF